MSLNIIVSLNFNEFKTHLIDKNQFNEKYLIILKTEIFGRKNNVVSPNQGNVTWRTAGSKNRTLKRTEKPKSARWMYDVGL